MLRRLAWIACIAFPLFSMAQGPKATLVATADTAAKNSFYISNREPLIRQHFIKLPSGSIVPAGWLKKNLELQRDGLTGHLPEISIWLQKQDNAWLDKDGKGKYGWEELPYWLKGYADIAYTLGDKKMMAEVKFWIDAVLSNQRPNGDFGPVNMVRGNRDLWANMPMLWCLQSWYEYTKDKRVLPFMERYFKFELTVPDSAFLKDYWENSRGGDNMLSVYWLYNHTGKAWLLDLATKLDRNTANWKQKNDLPNWHNVNVAQCFREPATYYLQSHKPEDLDATYNDFRLIRAIYGQVPGGMFGADENARKGYDDPRQAVETCGMVEQMTSDEYLLASTGDVFWADNCEDVAFNTFPAAFMADYRSLRYLTAPNMSISDSKNHSPGIANSGPFLMMNPFSSRCCQHNHSAGWVYYSENSWMATPDNGLAAQLYTAGQVKAKVGKGTEVKIEETTHYPFEGRISFTIGTAAPTAFPLYLRVPAWCDGASLTVNGKPVEVFAGKDNYIRVANVWKDKDVVVLNLPMSLHAREWTKNKNSISIDYGPLTYSLQIAENYVKKDSKSTAQDDAKWQAGADASLWPSFEITPGSTWNYGLLIDTTRLAENLEIIHRSWPVEDNPFTEATVPLMIRAKGKVIPSWTLDQYGLTGVLPQSPVTDDQKTEMLELIPMGAARLRISAFPVVAQ